MGSWFLGIQVGLLLSGYDLSTACGQALLAKGVCAGELGVFSFFFSTVASDANSRSDSHKQAQIEKLIHCKVAVNRQPQGGGGGG